MSDRRLSAIVRDADRWPFGELDPVVSTLERPLRFPGHYHDPGLDAAIRGSDFACLCERLLPHLDESGISETLLTYLPGCLAQGLVSRLD